MRVLLTEKAKEKQRFILEKNDVMYFKEKDNSRLIYNIDI